jgi:hypothetical protein
MMAMPGAAPTRSKEGAMPYMLIRHKVADYEKWKPAFDAHAPTRQAGSSKGGQLFRTIEDPNHLLILLEVEDLGKAQQFAQSDDLRETMQRPE